MRILIIGLGAIGQRHARNLRLLLGDRVELLALRQRGTGFALTESLELEMGVTPEDKLDMTVFRDLRRALATKPDGAVIANPSSMHLATARLVWEAGCALFIEKPLSHTWDGVPEFVSATRHALPPVLVGYQWRFHPLLARVQTLLEQLVFGRLIAVNAVYGEYMPDWHPYEDYRLSFAARRELGGGVLLTQIHDIDYLGWLVGWPRKVFSVGGHLSHLEIDVEDTASTLWNCHVHGRDIPVHLHQDYLQRPAVRLCEFLAEKGRIRCDLLAARLWTWDADGKCTSDKEFGSFHRNDMFMSEMKHFVACIEGRETPRVSPAEAAKSLAVALAALRSHASSQVEQVPYPETPILAARHT
jgi:predicted dehydrogenase